MSLADQSFVDVSATISKLKTIKSSLNESNNGSKHFIDEYTQYHSISVDLRKKDTEDLIMKYQPIINKIDNIIEDITVEANRLNASIKEAKNKQKEQEKIKQDSIEKQEKLERTNN